MTALTRLTLCAGLALAAACGDNTNVCGEGTVEQDGRCIGQVVPPVMCGEGTMFDEVSNTCVIDPAACQGGTVLIRGSCQDPAADLIPDLEEGTEPNGAGVAGEDSAAPAGVFVLPSIGAPGLVLHGTIEPQADRNEDGVPEPDIDTYLVETTAPAVLEITIDGLHGMAGGALVVSDVAGLEEWSRVAINLTGDTAKRRLFLPVAGRYRVGIADARSLVVPQAVVGGEDSEYYVTITQHPQTTPAPITLSGGMAMHTGALGPLDVGFFTAPLGTGQNDLTLSTEFDGTMGGLVVLVGGELAAAADELKLGPIMQDAALVVSGVESGEDVTIVLDHRISGTTTPVPFLLDIVARSTLR